MGLFKKRATPDEFGHAVLYLAVDWLEADAGQSLGMRFENFDGSEGWGKFLESQGISIPTQKLYFRHFAHCALQAASTQFDEATGRGITQGAMTGFKSKIDGYDFETAYRTLAAAYRGEHEFAPRVEALQATFEIPFLPDPDVGIYNAKYLLESFVIPNMPNSEAFVDDFELYSSTVSATVSTVQRAMEQLFRSFKLA